MRENHASAPADRKTALNAKASRGPIGTRSAESSTRPRPWAAGSVSPSPQS